MVSSFIDSLKLVLSDKYNVSDSDYKTLSDILLNKGLSEDALDSGLVQIISLLISKGYRFPISLDFLRELWSSENISYNFVKMLSGILKSGIISLRKVKRETVLSNNSITRSNTEDLDRDIIVVVYGSPVFNEILSEFEKVLHKPQELSEGVIPNIPKKLSNIVAKAAKLLKSLGINISIESYTSDSVLKVARLNLVLDDTSNYACGDNFILKTAKKYIKGKSIKGVETYKEDSKSIFLGIDISLVDSDYSLLADEIYSFVEELEVEGV